MKESQGKLANKHGRKNRDSLAAILLAHGFEDIGPINHDPGKVNVLDAFERQRLATLGQPTFVFAADVPVCHSIFGFEFRANFLVGCPHWPSPVVLMCRTQGKSGSALEKFEHLYANLDECVPCRSMVILSLESRQDDRSVKSKAIPKEVVRAVFRRAEQWIARSQGRIAHVFRGSDEFRRWLSDSCPYPAEPAQHIFA